MNKLEILNQLVEQAEKCTNCILYKNRNKLVFHSGDVNAKLMFCGESSGRDEDLSGVPFCGRSGKLLNNMIKAMGLERDSVYVTNACCCRPPNNRKPTPEEMKACFPFLEQKIKTVQPKVIVTLGSTAMETLLGPGEVISKRRGKWFEYIGIKVMPVWHPAFCLRNPSAKQQVWEDLQLVIKYLESNE